MIARMRAAAGLAAVLLVATVAGAQQWPTRPIRVISPFAAGSASDTTGRVVVDQVSQNIGQPIIVEVRPGAGGTLGFATVARADAPEARPDGTMSRGSTDGVLIRSEGDPYAWAEVRGNPSRMKP